MANPCSERPTLPAEDRGNDLGPLITGRSPPISVAVVEDNRSRCSSSSVPPTGDNQWPHTNWPYQAVKGSKEKGNNERDR